MARDKPYSEKFKILSIAGVDVCVHVVEDLSDEEIVEYFKIAIEKDNFEYADALIAEGKRRGLNYKLFWI